MEDTDSVTVFFVLLLCPSLPLFPLSLLALRFRGVQMACVVDVAITVLFRWLVRDTRPWRRPDSRGAGFMRRAGPSRVLLVSYLGQGRIYMLRNTAYAVWPADVFYCC